MKTQLNQISTQIFLFHVFSFIDFEDTYPWREMDTGSTIVQGRKC